MYFLIISIFWFIFVEATGGLHESSRASGRNHENHTKSVLQEERNHQRRIQIYSKESCSTGTLNSWNHTENDILFNNE